MFSIGFKASKCKTACKLCVSRIKLMKSKRNIQLSQMRKEIGNLLREGKDEYAWIRVEAVHREKSLLAGYEILELYLELVAVRAQLLEKAKETPKDMVEALTSLMYAATRVSDLPELLDVKKIISIKFGKELGMEGPNGEPTTWQAPEQEEKLSLLSQIAKEQGVEFDVEEYGRAIMLHVDRGVDGRPPPGGGGTGQQLQGSPGTTSFPGIDPNTRPTEAPPGWAGMFQDSPMPAAQPAEYPPGQVSFPTPIHSEGSGPPHFEPNFKVPVEGRTQGAYTDAQDAAIAALKAAESAKSAAEEARRYADQIPRPGEPVVPDAGHAAQSSGAPGGLPTPPAVKSYDELQEQYDAAPGAPVKKEDGGAGVPSAPPVAGDEVDLPPVPQGTDDPDSLDDLPGVGHLPGSTDKPEKSDELDELNKRFEILKKR